MSAIPSYARMFECVYEDAKYANGYAHIESTEVPRWVEEEIPEDDLGGVLSHAISDIEGKQREKLNALIADMLKQGDDIAQRKLVELTDMLRAALVDYCTRHAQRMVDERGWTDPEFPE